MTPVKPDSAREIIYYVLVAATFALVIVDLAGDGPQWGNIGVFVVIAASVFIRPGGLYKNRNSSPTPTSDRGAGRLRPE